MIALFGAALMALSVLAGCGSDTPPETTTTDEPSADDTTGATTRADADLVIWSDANRSKALEASLKTWADEQGITAAIQIVDELQNMFVTANEAGNGPDLVIGANDWTGNLVQNSSIVPVQISEDGLNPAAVDSVTYQGQVYGAPYALETLGLYSNPKFTAESAPATIEAMVAAAAAGGTEGAAENPLCLQVGTDGDAYHMQPLYTSAGGYIFGTNTDGTYNPDDVGVGQAGSLVAAQKIGALGADGVLKTSIDSTNSISLFAEGKCAYLVSGPWALQTLQPANMEFGLGSIPGFEGLNPAQPPLGVQAFFVASKAKNTAFAQQFVNDLLADTTITQAMYDLDPRVPVQDALSAAIATSDPIMAQFNDVAATAAAMPSISQMNAVWGPLGKAQAAIIGGADPDSTMISAGDEIKSTIG
ncbi:MAG: extracellular solute-binding protein [Propionibacteriaceae bacterium]|nr:extracellular solute-binding protein [Propionibacteriaceae bacterium]